MVLSNNVCAGVANPTVRVQPTNAVIILLRSLLVDRVVFYASYSSADFVVVASELAVRWNRHKERHSSKEHRRDNSSSQ